MRCDCASCCRCYPESPLHAAAQPIKYIMMLREHQGLGRSNSTRRLMMVCSLVCVQLLRIEGQGAYSGLVNGSPSGPAVSGEDETSVPPPPHAPYFTPAALIIVDSHRCLDPQSSTGALS